MKKRILALAAVIVYGTVQAQQPAKDLDEVIVTASRTEQKQSQTGKVVIVIDQATLQNNQGKSFTEILNQYAGIFTVGANNAPGSNQELYLRGAATGNTLILMDGVPLQDPSFITNVYDLNNINPEHIERIEILKGAQSTLWGSSAVAGVVNIITKKGGKKKITPTVKAAYGTYNTLNLSAGLNGAIDKFSYNLAYNRLTTDGFSAAHDSIGNQNFDKDGLRQNSFNAQVGYQFSGSLSANVTSNFSDYTADADAGAYVDDNDATANSRNFVNSIRVDYKRQRTQIHLIQSIINSKRKYTDDSLDVGGLRLNPEASFYTIWSDADYTGRSYVTDLYANHSFSRQVAAVFGLQYNHQKTTQSYKSISNYGPYDALPVSGDSARANYFAAYGSFLLTDLNGFNVELGGRFNRHNIYGNNATFTFNPSYNVNELTKVFVNISSGFNVPSLYQLYSESGNRQLKPEKSMNYEIGLQSFTNDNKNSFRLVAFKRDIKDLIVYYTDPETFRSMYINRDEQKDYGFEIESDVALSRWGQWRTNFTYINGEGISNDVKTRNLFRRPEFTVNSALTINPAENLLLIPSFRFIGERMAGPYDVGGPDPMPHYYLLNFYASYLVKKKAKLFVDFRNITNQKYFDVYGYNSRAFNMNAGVSVSL
ncbi:TonB-dependent receptor plug domain-containing protein [Niabella insulamsoli]|uniref:TonB-dependent receptor plug domain-containing protein n=1 Tax=Niabella insulamsoli TaxID=3144874 RepID=UPI0031FC571F